MNVRKWLPAMLTPLAVLLFPGQALADIGSGDCTGTVRFVTGTEDSGPFSVDADRPLTDVVVVPRSDTAEWSGSTPATSGESSGSVTVDLPFPLGSYEIQRWSGTVQTSTNSGTETYDLPRVIPGGVEFRVSATHRDDAGTCRGSLTVRIEGGAFGSAVTPIALVVTVILGAVLVVIAGVFGGAVKSGAVASAIGGRT